jgi:hypothetical protein
LFEVQLNPVAGIPFEQVQEFAWQATPLSVQPVRQLAHIAPLLDVQFAPVAALPLEQVHTLA